jgi:hypothetical protein
MRRTLLLPALMLTGCYFHKPSDQGEGGLDARVASGPDGRHHADGVPAREDERPGDGAATAPQGPTATVTLSGTARYGGQGQGSLRVDLHRQEGSEDRPSLLGSTAVDADGNWALEVPQGTGRVLLCGYLDHDDNGPSVGEPKVVLPGAAVVAQSAVGGLTLELLDDWDQRRPETLRSLHLAPAEVGPQPHPSQQGSP